MAGSAAVDSSVVRRARALAEEVLFPAALDVDAVGRIPPGHFDRLAAEGFYGLVGERADGGGEVDLSRFTEIVEILSGGCLTTTFTWMQHHSVVRALTRTANQDLRQKYLRAAVRGEVRGGVVLAGAIPRPPRLWATAIDGGWLLDGAAPLVTGWGIVDVLLVMARDTAAPAPAPVPDLEPDSGTVVCGLLDPVAGAGIAVEELRLIAAQGSNTVRLRFDNHYLPAELVTAQIPQAEFLATQHISARLNGCLALGVASRCIRLLADRAAPGTARRLRAEHSSIRARLDSGMEDRRALPAARAAASEFAYRMAGALVTSVGSTAILHRQHANRLVRESIFTLVAAGRPEIKNELLGLFVGPT